MFYMDYNIVLYLWGEFQAVGLCGYHLFFIYCLSIFITWQIVTNFIHQLYMDNILVNIFISRIFRVMPLEVVKRGEMLMLYI